MAVGGCDCDGVRFLGDVRMSVQHFINAVDACPDVLRGGINASENFGLGLQRIEINQKHEQATDGQLALRDEARAAQMITPAQAQ